MTCRKDLKPWVRKIPRPILIGAIFPMFPIYILVGVSRGLYKGFIDSIQVWVTELKLVLELKD